MGKKLYRDKDVNMSIIDGLKIAVVGYGTQGKSRALNMRDSGLDVVIGANKDHPDWKAALSDGFEVMTIEGVAQTRDIFELQIPDMAYRCAKAYNEQIKPLAKKGHMVCLSSAMNYYYGHMDISEDIDAIVTAAKAPGSAVRSEYLSKKGVPALLVIHHNGSGKAWDKGLAICKGMGFTMAGVQESTVEEETVTDLLGEHCAWGAIVMLLKTVYEVMVEAGYDPEVAFYEAVNESKLTTDLIYKFGMAGMLERISNTAAFGAMAVGPKIIDEGVKNKIRWAMENIKNGGFDKVWKEDYENNYKKYNELLNQIREHQAEVVGNRVRKQLGVLEDTDRSSKNILK